MGFFKKAFKAVSKPVASTIKSTVKNAVPITAAYLTSGASLSVMKPSSGFLDKIPGFGNGGGGESIADIATSYAQEKVTNEANRFVDKQLDPKTYQKPAQNISSKRFNSQSSIGSKPFSESVSESFNSVSNAVGGKSKLTMIVGGVIALILVAVLIGRKK